MEPEIVPARHTRAAIAYVRKLLEALDLVWSVGIADTYDERADVGASISAVPNVCEATLYLGPGWDCLEDDERGVTLLHEVLHLTNSAQHQFVNAALVPALQRGAQDLAARAYDDYDETFIDHLARALYSRMPQYGKKA